MSILISLSNWQWNRWDGTAALMNSLFVAITETILPTPIICWQIPCRYLSYSLCVSNLAITHLQNSATLVQRCNNSCGSQQPSTKAVFMRSLQCLSPGQPASGCHQGFLATVLAFPLGPVLIWVISTSVRVSGGRHERMRSMVFW